MLKSLEFSNYKGFEETQKMEIKPITLIIGKNSSGKSSICKLLPILRDGFANPDGPFPLISKEGIRLSHTYRDLFHNHDFTKLFFKLSVDDREFELNYIIDDGQFLNLQRGKERVNSFAGKDFERENVFLNVNYIGPIRKHNVESFSIFDSERLGYSDAQGGEAYGRLLKSFLTDSVLLDNVGGWMNSNMDGQKFILEETDSQLGFVSPMIEHNGVKVHISEVGEGITQVLPIITQSFINQPDTITILEQPALHLHPSIHPIISQRLAESALSTGQHFVIESHSKTLLLGFIRMVTSQDSPFSSSDLAIYYIDSDENASNLKKIEVDKDGNYDWWPVGLFQDDFDLEEKIIEKI